ncbi:MAG: redoxin domain-containing protein [Phycisphaerae bacterium]
MNQRRKHFVTGSMLGGAAAVLLLATSGLLAQETKKLKKFSVEPGKGPKPIQLDQIQQLPRGGQTGSRTLKEVDPNADQPIFSIDSLTHNFGTTWVGPKLEHTFKVTNKGTKTLEITKVRPSCGCTVAGNYPRKLEPGETGDFPFSINSNKVRGRYSKSISISCNDPVNSDLRLTLTGECKRYIDVIPAAANFGRVYGDSAQERILKVTNNTDEPIELELDVPSDSKFSYKLVEIEKGSRYEVRVALLDTKMPIGSARSTATLKTNVEAQKQIRLTATATVPKRIDIVPATISLASAAATRSQTRGTSRIVRVTNYGSTPMKVLGIPVDDPTITATLSEKSVGKNYDVRLDFPVGWEAPPTGRTLTINTDDSEFKTIKVPIRTQAARNARRTARRPAEELVGKKAPHFAAKTLAGKDIGTNTLASAITVIDFFAVNCGYCAKQIPRLETIRKKFESRGVRFVAAAETMRGKRFSEQQVMDKLKTLGFGGEVLLDPDNEIGPLYKATSFPTMVVLGKSGKVEAVNIGNISDLETRLVGQLNALLSGKPLPSYQAKKPPTPRQRPVDQLVGKPAPKFAAKTTAEKDLGTDTFSKEITVLDFFAVNCGFCAKQIPRLEAIRKEYEAKGVRFVAAAETMHNKKYTNEEVMDKIKTLGFRGEVLMDQDNAVGPLYKATGFPTMVVVGKSGKVEAVNVGNIGDLETRLKGQLDALLAGKAVPSYAAKTPPTRKRPAEGMVGKPAPSFSLTTLGGKPISNSDFKSHPATVLNFVAPNCGFCKRQLPNVEKIREAYAAKGIRFVNMSQTMRKKYTPEEASDVFKGVGSRFEIAMDDDNAIGRQFKATSYPTMMVIGKDGKIAHVNIGAKKDIDKILASQLDGLIKKNKG